jgi:hypothetical protein
MRYLFPGLFVSTALASSAALGAECIPAPRNLVCPSGFQIILTAVPDASSPTKFREERTCCQMRYNPVKKLGVKRTGVK